MVGEDKRGPGRPAHKPTDETRALVRSHTSVGGRQELISGILGITDKTLAKHYRHELATARAMANAAVGVVLYEKAMSGDTALMIFWLKTRARWRETPDLPNERQPSTASS